MNEYIANCGLAAISGICLGVAAWSIAVGVGIFAGLLAILETMRLFSGRDQ